MVKFVKMLSHGEQTFFRITNHRKDRHYWSIFNYSLTPLFDCNLLEQNFKLTFFSNYWLLCNTWRFRTLVDSRLIAFSINVKEFPEITEKNSKLAFFKILDFSRTHSDFELSSILRTDLGMVDSLKNDSDFAAGANRANRYNLAQPGRESSYILIDISLFLRWALKVSRWIELWGQSGKVTAASRLEIPEKSAELRCSASALAGWPTSSRADKFQSNMRCTWLVRLENQTSGLACQGCFVLQRGVPVAIDQTIETKTMEFSYFFTFKLISVLNELDRMELNSTFKSFQTNAIKRFVVIRY